MLPTDLPHLTVTPSFLISGTKFHMSFFSFKHTVYIYLFLFQGRKEEEGERDNSLMLKGFLIILYKETNRDFEEEVPSHKIVTKWPNTKHLLHVHSLLETHIRRQMLYLATFQLAI